MKIDNWETTKDTFGTTYIKAEVPLFNTTYVCEVKGSLEGTWKAGVTVKESEQEIPDDSYADMVKNANHYNDTEFSNASDARKWCENYLDSHYMPEFSKFRYTMLRGSCLVDSNDYLTILDIPLENGTLVRFNIMNVYTKDIFCWNVNWSVAEHVNDDGTSQGLFGTIFAEYKDEAWLISCIDKTMKTLAEHYNTEYNILV